MKGRADFIMVWVAATAIAGVLFVGLYFVTKYVVAHSEEEEVINELEQDEHDLRGKEVKPEPSPEGDSHSNSGKEPTHQSKANINEIYWDYRGAAGPEFWGALASEFKACSTGKYQSPIDLAGAVGSRKLAPLKFNYQSSRARVSNDGNLIVLKIFTDNYLEIDENSYRLEKIIFHTPSEHYLEGAPYDLEIQFLHRKDDKIIVLAVLAEEKGVVNPSISKIWERLPKPKDIPEDLTGVNLRAILPADHKYVFYHGSLTYPPCQEDVDWYVMASPIQIAATQTDYFVRFLKFNARPLQDLHDRKLLKSVR